MKKVHLGILSLAVATLFLGCSSDSAPVSYLEGSPAPITTVEEASNTLSTVSSLTEAGTVGASLSIARAAALSVKSLAPSLATQTQECPYGGSFTIDGTSETSFTGTYSNCDLGYGMVIDGGVKVSGDTLTFSNLTMSDGAGMSMKLNISIVDVNHAGTDVTMNGTIAMTDSTGSASLGYQNYKYVARTNGDFAVNGDISINSTIYPCNNGTFAISTIVDLTPDLSGTISSGTIKVNGVTFQFINSTQVTVTFADGTSETVTQGLDAICTAS